MMLFTDYARVKDRYCICYFGYSDEYLILLRLIFPLLEKQFPGLQICFGCKDEKQYLLGGASSLKLSEIKMERGNYAYIREIGFNGISHPIEDLLTEAGIIDPIICSHILPRTTNLCVITTEGAYPTKNLTSKQVEIISNQAKEKGFDVTLNSPVDNASLVVGVESVALFEAASRGIQTILIPTGVGLRLYKMLFPSAEVDAK